jgi:hypothetical protein
MNPLLNMYGYVSILIVGIAVLLISFIVEESNFTLRLIIGFIGSALIAIAILAVTVVK